MARRKRKLMAEINVVPYIDIMLVLLVVFMVTAPLFSQGYQVDLPATAARPFNIKKETQIVVSVTEQREYYYSQGSINKKVTIKELQDIMKSLLKEEQKPAIFVKGDKEVAYGAVISLMDALQKAGVNNVGLLTQPPPTSR